MRTPRLTAFLVAFTALCATGARAQTDMVLVSTIGQAANAVNSISNTESLATKFTVESGSDYTLTSVTVDRGDATGDIDVAIHEPAAGNGSNPADTALYIARASEQPRQRKPDLHGRLRRHADADEGHELFRRRDGNHEQFHGSSDDE